MGTRTFTSVQPMLGQASAAMTLDTYADLCDTDLDAVGDALDRACTESSVGKMCAGGPGQQIPTA